MSSQRVWVSFIVSGVVAVLGCEGQPGGGYKTAEEISKSAPSRPANADDHDHDHGHHHEPPHGGTLTMLGEHAAQVELLLDKETGKLTAYGLDGEGEKGLPFEQGEIELKLTSIGGKPADAAVVLKAENLTENKAKTYVGTVEGLKGQTEFSGVYSSIMIPGQKAFEQVKVSYKPGHDDHDHAKEGDADHKAGEQAHDDVKKDDSGHKEGDHKEGEEHQDEKEAAKPAESK